MDERYPPYPTFRYWLFNHFAGVSVGDTKDAFALSDHNGWVILDGRSTDSLSIQQKAAALGLGFALQIPDASNCFAVQNGSILGSSSGSNGKVLLRSHLPNVQIGGNTSSDFIVSNFSTKAGADQTLSPNGKEADPSVPLEQSHGSHSHNITTDFLSGGVSNQVPFDVTPKSMSVNKFVYLGL